jgi:hypothetical protein
MSIRCISLVPSKIVKFSDPWRGLARFSKGKPRVRQPAHSGWRSGAIAIDPTSAHARQTSSSRTYLGEFLNATMPPASSRVGLAAPADEGGAQFHAV